MNEDELTQNETETQTGKKKCIDYTNTVPKSSINSTKFELLLSFFHFDQCSALSTPVSPFFFLQGQTLFHFLPSERYPFFIFSFLSSLLLLITTTSISSSSTTTQIYPGFLLLAAAAAAVKL